MNYKTSTDDPLIPPGFAVREHDESELDPEIRKAGCLWVARHEGFDPLCDWYSWHRSYPSAVLASRVHANVCLAGVPRRSKRSR